MKRPFKWLTSMAVAATTLTSIGFAAQPAFASTALTESGSSLLYPLFQTQWIPAYQQLHSSVQLTADSTGSGTGIADAEAGLVDIGASDAYLLARSHAAVPDTGEHPIGRFCANHHVQSARHQDEPAPPFDRQHSGSDVRRQDHVVERPHASPS